MKADSYDLSVCEERKMHSGMKTYGCELCGKSFLDSLRLRMHLLSHSGKEIKRTQNPKTTLRSLSSYACLVSC
ncbi:Zinc finger and BTB domain containing protein 16-A [Dissostichus eleginoides]|uniref:Zinc finger and BTB domain containing protein 16-A n=1 Tax=Dissostichus eleginoides TaxID=100907 RepID=A0AAD9BF13_DISEL|nr:Zinc finger and BTB domain containing protein 16-A [Dissostichus eleginoides]